MYGRISVWGTESYQLKMDRRSSVTRNGFSSIDDMSEGEGGTML